VEGNSAKELTNLHTNFLPFGQKVETIFGNIFTFTNLPLVDLPPPGIAVIFSSSLHCLLSLRICCFWPFCMISMVVLSAGPIVVAVVDSIIGRISCSCCSCC
jgi:hypothetical protein